MKIIEVIAWVLSAISIYGVYINIKKDPLYFKLWLITNGFWVAYDIYKHAWPQVFIFFIYFVLAIKGIIDWEKEKQKPKERKLVDPFWEMYLYHQKHIKKRSRRTHCMESRPK